tara:strand:- start:1357 stop:1917 length:561 start_codon:yes stop_codon:yes gene_type:complete
MAEKKQSVLLIKDFRFLEGKDPQGVYNKATLKRLYGIIAKLEKYRSNCSTKEKTLLRKFKDARFGYLLGKDEIPESPLRIKGLLQIEGKFKGEISGPETLIIGESANLDAQIRAETIICKGKLKGKAKASAKIEITETGRVLANVSTPSLEIAEGGVFKGKCHMAPKTKPARPQAISRLRRFFLAG